MKLKQQLIRTSVMWVALSGWLLLANPERIPVVLLVVPFALLYFALYELCILMAFLWQRYAKGKPRPESEIRQSARFLSIFISFIAVLGSLGQLVLRDIITLFLLFVVGYFYLVRARKRSRTN